MREFVNDRVRDEETDQPWILDNAIIRFVTRRGQRFLTSEKRFKT